LSAVEPHATLVFVRHGQSEWNELNLFTGWADVELTDLGRAEAAAGAADLKATGLSIDVAYTSLLKRAQNTLEIVLDGIGQDPPVHKDYRLNERHYGSLQGMDKKQTVQQYGKDQVQIWRRSYDVPPPPVDLESPFHPKNDPKYEGIPISELPSCECLKDTVERCLPLWRDEIEPQLRAGKTVLVAAHGNSIRGLLKVIDDISVDAITGVEIPTGVPLCYKLDKSLTPLFQSDAVSPLRGAFLGDPAAIAAARAAVAAQTGSTAAAEAVAEALQEGFPVGDKEKSP
jgi:2,3-bisphosphoglycerate-dependent phosphoglycerate mutase